MTKSNYERDVCKHLDQLEDTVMNHSQTVKQSTFIMSALVSKLTEAVETKYHVLLPVLRYSCKDTTLGEDIASSLGESRIVLSEPLSDATLDRIVDLFTLALAANLTNFMDVNGINTISYRMWIASLKQVKITYEY